MIWKRRPSISISPNGTSTPTQTTETYPLLSYDAAANTATFTFSAGQVTSEKIYQGGTTLLRTINTSYAPGGGITTVTRTTILQDNSTQTKTVSQYDSNTNLLSRTEFAWGTGAPGALVL